MVDSIAAMAPVVMALLLECLYICSRNRNDRRGEAEHATDHDDEEQSGNRRGGPDSHDRKPRCH